MLTPRIAHGSSTPACCLFVFFVSFVSAGSAPSVDTARP